MTLRFADPSARADLGAFTARLVRLDATAAVRLRAARGRVTAWAETPFETLATRSVDAVLDAAELTVLGSALLTALEIERSAEVDLGAGGAPWLGELPPDDGWVRIEDVPAGELEALTDRGLTLAREHGGPLGPPASLLDQTVLKVSGNVPGTVTVPMRALFALSGMGFLGGADTGADGTGVVRVSATGSWLRLDARFGAVVRRRVMSLPLLT
ncbi:hypothetical protein [Pseudonocardia oroxyli]|uniref:Uncharacterized protein n=1 Tax=Pseudonocardia oroxyli TaxID=366584 RepID=A0A1G7WFA1_PSEOR|nr:hypothetical protein [Pseudonocardia oroxyli]SDG70534.1 hypothetical protein SAMN05216377_114101 [Pseudonocardia oroxyli]